MTTGTAQRLKATRTIFRLPETVEIKPAEIPAQATISAVKPLGSCDAIDFVVSGCGIAKESLGSRTRHPQVVWARRLIIRCLRDHTTLSYPELAKVLGRPNHSTIITAYFRFADILYLPFGAAEREITWLMQTRDVGDILNVCLSEMRRRRQVVEVPFIADKPIPRYTPVDRKPAIRVVLSDKQPRTSREIAVEVLTAQNKPLVNASIRTIQRTVTGMYIAGGLEVRGAKVSHDSLQRRYVLTESKA